MGNAMGMQEEPKAQLSFCFDVVIRPGAKPGEHIITQRPNPTARGTVRMAAQTLGCSVDTIHRLIKKEKINATQPNGGKWVVDMGSVYAHRDATRNIVGSPNSAEKIIQFQRSA